LKIIKKIEVNYFRSIYSAALVDCSDLNVIVGGNDVGKSNFLKALNLFFNNDTELGRGFSFYDDLSRVREREARVQKGRATIWIKVTFNNYENWDSLPNTFVVKKTWTRYDATPEVGYPGNPAIPNTTLGKFLNKIAFHYIPAVRGREIFSHYLNLLHDSLIEDERAGISGATAGLMQRINEGTEAMSAKIAEQLGFDSTIGAPRDLRQLFSALDFQTRFGDYEVPLQRRGDGIQVTHIPFILDFIANRSKKNHIWAYEEPENSLEMARSFELAEQFRSVFSTSNQVFLTTHSPAFYDLSGDEVSRWLIDSEPHPSLEEPATTTTPLARSAASDEAVGVSALIAERARKVYEELESSRMAANRLREKLKEASLPQVVVEGPSDRIILEAACRKLGHAERWCDFVDAGSAQHVTRFVAAVDRLNAAGHKPVIGVVDRDREGKGAMKPFHNRHLVDGTDVRIVNKTKSIFCSLLPVPEHVAKANAILRKAGIPKSDLPVTIESMLTPACIARAIDAGVLQTESVKGAAKTANLEVPMDLSETLGQRLPGELRYLAYTVRDQSKVKFAQWLEENAGTEAFQPLGAFLDQLSAILEPYK